MKYLISIYLLFCFGFLFSQSLETLAGSGERGLVNGSALTAQFAGLEQTAVDSEGNIYLCDTDNHVIRVITNGVVSTYAGTGVAGDVLGSRESAQFNFPIGIAIDDEDNIYISDSYNFKIKVIRPDGMVEFIAGTGEEGSMDGDVSMAQFDHPVYLCVDDSNNLFVTGNEDNRIRKIDMSTNLVSTYAGSGLGYQDGPSDVARFNRPQGIAIDIEGNLFVGDRDNHVIRKISPDGMVTTLAGTGFAGYFDGAGSQAAFNGPKGVAVDAFGNVYVADRLNFVVRKIDPEGVVSTVAGMPGISGYEDGGFLEGNLIGRAVAVMLIDEETVVVTDWENEVIRILDLSTSTSVTNLERNNTIYLTPNPASHTTLIKGELGDIYTVVVYDASGRFISSGAKRSVDLEYLSSGIYYVKIFNEAYSNVEKLIIE